MFSAAFRLELSLFLPIPFGACHTEWLVKKVSERQNCLCYSQCLSLAMYARDPRGGNLVSSLSVHRSRTLVI